MLIGWASRDVSSNERVTITGQAFERISTGVFDPTTITVLVMDDGKDNVIFISGDFTGITKQLIHEVKEAVKARQPEIDGSKIVFNATHTHTAPRYMSLSGNGYDKAPRDRVNVYSPDKYRAFLVDQVSDAVVEAYNGREEGSFSYGYGSAAVAIHRRATYLNDRSAKNNANDTFGVNGYAQMYGPTNVDDFAGFEGTIDTKAYLLYTFDKNDNLTGAIVNINCPSQCTELENFTSADYWHETREMIRERHGNIYILPQCAAAGDQSPHILHGSAEFNRKNALKFGNDPKAEQLLRPWEYYNRKIIAERIAYAFDECLEWASREKITDAPITHVTKTVSLDAWKVTDEEYKSALEGYEECKKQEFVYTDDPEEDFKVNTKISSNISRYEGVIEKYNNGVKRRNAEIHVLKIGDIAFATNPFELYTDYQHRIQARSPFVQTFIVQLTASDVASAPGTGYLATARAAANKGYSAIMFSCNVSPEGGSELVEETLKELNSIK